MDSVKLVKNICKERNIPISKLERDCGFSNGYIRKLKEGKFPSDRLLIISQYLGVSTSYLLGLSSVNDYEPNSALVMARGGNNPDIVALVEAALKCDPEQIKKLTDFLISLDNK